MRKLINWKVGDQICSFVSNAQIHLFAGPITGKQVFATNITMKLLGRSDKLSDEISRATPSGRKTEKGAHTTTARQVSLENSSMAREANVNCCKNLPNKIGSHGTTNLPLNVTETSRWNFGGYKQEKEKISLKRRQKYF